MPISYSPTLGKVLDYLVEKATPQAIMAISVSDEEQQRAHELLDRNNEGTLTEQERVELEQMLEVEQLVKLLKAKALLMLSRAMPRQPGLHQGAFSTSDDFDNPLPDEFWLGAE